jgi:deoxycytidine triphosphate deaminase
MRVAQLVFLSMEEPPEVAYGEGGKGNYQGQRGTTKSWSEDFFPKLMSEKDKK